MIKAWIQRASTLLLMIVSSDSVVQIMSDKEIKKLQAAMDVLDRHK